MDIKHEKPSTENKQQKTGEKNESLNAYLST